MIELVVSLATPSKNFQFLPVSIRLLSSGNWTVKYLRFFFRLLEEELRRLKRENEEKDRIIINQQEIINLFLEEKRASFRLNLLRSPEAEGQTQNSSPPSIDVANKTIQIGLIYLVTFEFFCDKKQTE